MKIDEIIYKLNAEIEKQYGIRDAVHTLVMSHEAFDRTVIEMFRSDPYRYRFSPSEMNDMQILGVRILAREKESK